MAFPMLVAAFALAFQLTSISHRRLELQVSLDAAALAGANALVDDILLSDLPERKSTVMGRVRERAERYAELNTLLGDPVLLESNEENDRAGEIVVGRLPFPRSRDMDNSASSDEDRNCTSLNTVRITAKRRGVSATSTAHLDRDVLGFKIEGSQSVPGQTAPCIPVVPFAIFSDLKKRGDDGEKDDTKRRQPSWDEQMDSHRRTGDDEGRQDEDDGRSEHRGLRIPEIKLIISERERDANDNACLVGVGVHKACDAVRQIRTGMTAEDLRSRNFQLLLGTGSRDEDERGRLTLPHLAPREGDLAKIAAALDAIRGEQRVWMLHPGEDQRDDDRNPIVGFVAGKVIHVKLENVKDEKNEAHERLVIILQPTMMITATAVTDRTRRNSDSRSILNPYICRVRLVD